MTAISAAGGTLPDHFTIVNSPIIGGATLVQVDSAPHLVLDQIPTVPQRGTRPAVETPVAPPEIQRIDNARRDHQSHDDTTASTTLPLTPQLSPNTYPLSPDPQPCRVDLDALERKIRSIGARIDRMLLTADNRHAPHRRSCLLPNPLPHLPLQPILAFKLLLVLTSTRLSTRSVEVSGRISCTSQLPTLHLTTTIHPPNA